MLCPATGKRQYRSYYSADRRLKKEKCKYKNKGGWVYKCEHCKKWHITYHTYSHDRGKYKRSSKNNAT